MAGKTPPKAVQDFVKPIQLALSCVTNAQITRSGDYRTTADHVLVVADGEPFALPRTSGSALRARVSQNYRIVPAEGPRGPWKVTTTAYLYTLEEADGLEILSYQWHPSGPSSVHYPHLHVGQAAGKPRPELQRAHLPTGRISLEQFLWLAIEAFKVRPRRDDRRDVLYRTLQKFEQWRTWA